MRVVVAGTFGPLHDGHRALLQEALRNGDEGVVVGLTSDRFANATREREVPAFESRRRSLAAALSALDEWGRDVEVVRIDDEFGVAVEDGTLDAIVVSTETEDEVAAVNRRRRERGMEPLEPIVVPVVEAEDGGRISSTRIVRGEVDERGHAVGS